MVNGVNCRVFSYKTYKLLKPKNILYYCTNINNYTQSRGTLQRKKKQILWSLR